MKRLMTALAPTLMTGALLGIGVAGLAQTNTLSLVGDIPDVVNPGDVYTLELQGETGGDAVATTFQTLFRYDPDVMDVTFTIAFTPSSEVANNILRTVNINGGEYDGPNVMKQSTFGLSPATNGVDLGPNTVLGTFEVRILDTAAAGTTADFGLSQALITDATVPNNRLSVLTSTPTQATVFGGDGQLRPSAFRVGVVPGPSSLAVFALGGLAPAMALLRRRRSK